MDPRFLVEKFLHTYYEYVCKAVLSMFCSNHVQNMEMEHVLVHVLFLFSLIFVSEHKNTNFGT